MDGYWTMGDGTHWWFPDQDARRAGEAMRTRWRSRRAGARLSRWSDDIGTAMASRSSSSSYDSSDDDDNGSSWSSGSSRRRSYSSRTRSSGGGSSRRSSRRSGGSRGF
jgi:hypothetical protein